MDAAGPAFFGPKEFHFYTRAVGGVFDGVHQEVRDDALEQHGVDTDHEILFLGGGTVHDICPVLFREETKAVDGVIDDFANIDVFFLELFIAEAFGGLER